MQDQVREEGQEQGGESGAIGPEEGGEKAMREEWRDKGVRKDESEDGIQCVQKACGDIRRHQGEDGPHINNMLHGNKEYSN